MLVSSKGDPALRDIVQFVTLSEFSNIIGKLAEEVLQEMPSQIENYLLIENSL